MDKGTPRRLARRVLQRDLAGRVAELEREVQELRRTNLRLAELTDVVEELLIPLASRDQGRIDAALAQYPRRL